MKSKIQNSKFKILIVGAGPSGASLAIRLAKANFRVILIEREKFPRRKLCGEFISPECLTHFQDLGVLDEMLASGGERITETVFYEPNGKSVSVPSRWFGGGALSLSRARMDFLLLEKAREVGVEVFDETQVVGVMLENTEVRGVKIKPRGSAAQEISADLTIDASGRANVLSKFLEKEIRFRNSGFGISASGFENSKTGEFKPKIKNKIQNRLVGFKTHLKNVELNKGACEIYFFRGGYGGLSFVENNLANHCFLIKAEIVKAFDSDAEKIVREVIFQNKRAAQTMKNAAPVEEWLAVSVDGFGLKTLNPAKNLFAVGDAGAFIDPFTGSGMLMALESAEILANIITENNFAPEQIARVYKISHRRQFQKRLFVCSLMRRAAFVPQFAELAIFALNRSSKLREIAARSTRRKFLPVGNE